MTKKTMNAQNISPGHTNSAKRSNETSATMLMPSDLREPNMPISLWTQNSVGPLILSGLHQYLLLILDDLALSLTRVDFFSFQVA